MRTLKKFSKPALYQSDKRTGYRYAPHVNLVDERGVPYFTDCLGLRAAEPTTTTGQVHLAFLGCSWAAAFGLDYKKSFTYLVEQQLGQKAANLGCGSYSLLQAIRLLEMHIACLRPQIVIMLYGPWQTNRCFRGDGFERAFIRRPIYMLNKEGTPCLVELQYVVPSFAMRWAIQVPGLLSLLNALYFKTKKYDARRRDYTYVKKADDYRMRSFVIADCLKRITDLQQQWRFKFIVHFLYPINSRNRLAGYLPLMAMDNEIMKNFIKGLDGCYVSPVSQEVALYEQWLRVNRSGADFDVGLFAIPNDGHPNEIGREIIARSIMDNIQAVQT